MNIKQQYWILLIIILIIMSVSACSPPQPDNETTNFTPFTVIFDGENCMVTGPEEITTKWIVFELDNQSDTKADLLSYQIKEGTSADEIFNSFAPGSIDLPVGASIHSQSMVIPGGSSFDHFRRLYGEGNYVVFCENYSTTEKYYGASFSVQN